MFELIADRSGGVGQASTFSLLGIDSDLPPQTLSNGLSGDTRGATLGPTTEKFSWIPSAINIGTNLFTVFVRDTFLAQTSTTFRIVVINAAPPPRLEASRIAGSQIQLASPAQVGRRYRFEHTESLTPPAWRTLIEVTATAGTIAVSDAIQSAQPARYYRLVRLP